ncbi:polysaccharide pyruvyl transferase CsaB [Romboutsia lituseburensis]|uniref:polysaccharide pyruvyl transferase CsaB n=1 Tax=Romboutsia lituseburensis TaxID=1537 RepID=UPI00215A1F18|nr:polysaccharide pyruvyl transferase CsaB [Romboutsia lituseburensis]MCR8745430.1 polysaccharide pyruvyl transferase CsaB [Romboutsia lituseburensis]
MKVVISGYYGYNNVGDEAILKSIITALRNENSNIDIVVLSNDVDYTEKTYNVKAINRWKMVDIYKELRKSDGLISGGGSLLQDVTSNRPVKYYTGIIALAKLAKKPVFIYAQGVGPINNSTNKKITKYFMQKSNYIALRDEDSKNLVKSIGVTKQIEIVPDPVMGFEIENFDSDLCNDYGDSFVSISVREWTKATTDFLGKVAKTCDELVDKGYEVVFLPMHGEHDDKISKQVVQMMKNNAHVFPYDTSIEEKILCIKKSKLMIGMRLHALIFAASVNTPMIGISYDPKIDSFLKLVNQPCIGSVDNNWSSEELLKKTISIINNYDNEKQKLSVESKLLKKSAQKTAKIAIEIFKDK